MLSKVGVGEREQNLLFGSVHYSTTLLIKHINLFSTFLIDPVITKICLKLLYYLLI